MKNNPARAASGLSSVGRPSSPPKVPLAGVRYSSPMRSSRSCSRSRSPACLAIMVKPMVMAAMRTTQAKPIQIKVVFSIVIPLALLIRAATALLPPPAPSRGRVYFAPEPESPPPEPPSPPPSCRLVEDRINEAMQTGECSAVSRGEPDRNGGVALPVPVAPLGFGVRLLAPG